MDDDESNFSGVYRMRRERVAVRVPIAAFALIVWLLPNATRAADVWGGSLAATSDYLVRGISRSNHDPALQGDLHFATDGGLIAGLFASSTKLTPYDRRDAEVGALVGYAWQPSNAWRAKLLASYYSYPWNDQGSQYNYGEFRIEAAYNDWLNLGVAYSPHAHYLPDQSSASATSAELTLRTPWRHRLAATAGVGHSVFTDSEGSYTYWSAGGMIDLAPWLITLAFVSTDAAAQSIFYNEAAHDRWAATVIWRF